MRETDINNSKIRRKNRGSRRGVHGLARPIYFMLSSLTSHLSPRSDLIMEPQVGSHYSPRSDLIWAPGPISFEPWGLISLGPEASSHLGPRPHLIWAPGLISLGPRAWSHLGLRPDLISAYRLILFRLRKWSHLGRWSQSHLGPEADPIWSRGMTLFGPGTRSPLGPGSISL